MDLEHPQLEPFEPLLRRLMETAFTPPLLFPRTAILSLRWAPGGQRRRFVAETFAAYGGLQQAVAENVISLERQAQALTQDRKRARRARDSAAEASLSARIEIVRRRQLILRRMLDAIVYVLCDQYVWFIRRLALQDHVRPVDPENVAHIVEWAVKLNERDPYTLYLVSDLTTAVQLGDLVRVSVDSQLRWRIRLIEVKEGKVNRILRERMSAGASPDTMDSIRETMGEKTAQQAERVLRQQRRIEGLTDIVRDRRGIDPRTGAELERTPDAPPTPGYQPELRALIEETARAGQHLIRLDGCLTLAAIRADMLQEPHLVSAVHSLFHYKHPGVACLLHTDRGQQEVDALLGEPPVIDMVEHTYPATWGSPVLSWGTVDRVCDLLTGRIKVYAQLDAAAFMERAASMGIRMNWVTRRRAEMLKQTRLTTWIPGGPKASAILVELPDGTKFELLSGGLARIFLELAKPDALLGLLLTSGPHVRKAQQRAVRGGES